MVYGQGYSYSTGLPSERLAGDGERLCWGVGLLPEIPKMYKILPLLIKNKILCRLYSLE